MKRRSFSKNVRIEINDIFDELSQENQRLNKNLVFATKCLNVLNDIKNYSSKIHKKYETTIDCEDQQKFNQLIQRFNSIINSNEENIDHKSQYLDENDVDIEETPNNVSNNENVENIGPVQWSQQQNGQSSEERSIYSRFMEKMTEKLSFNVIKYFTENLPSYEEREGFFNPKTNYYYCRRSGCLKKFRTNSELLIHLYKMHRKPDYSCGNPYCDKVFKGITMLNKHRHIGYLECCYENCSFKTISGNILRVHLMSHSDKHLFKCDLNDCKKSFKTLDSLKSHLKTHSSINKSNQMKVNRNREKYKYWDVITQTFKCPFNACNKTFDSNRKAGKHVSTYHRGPFPCPICHKEFRTREASKKHSMVHSAIKHLSCPNEGCPFKTKDPTGLKLHVQRKHTTGFPHICDFHGCEEKFKTRQDLWFHSKLHACEPTIKCRFPSCDQCFYSYPDLQKHYYHSHKIRPKKPTVYMPIACEWPGCDYKARNKYVLKMHRRGHTGEKPYVCQFPNCGKSFRFPKNYKEHQNLHLNVKPFSCSWPGCLYTTASSPNIFKHIKQVHKK